MILKKYNQFLTEVFKIMQLNLMWPLMPSSFNQSSMFSNFKGPIASEMLLFLFLYNFVILL
jgi:hypothetical protein